MADLIQLRRDTAANWTSANPTLSQGEQGYETDTGKMKIGDGSTAWTSLAYFVDSSAYATSSDITSAVSTKANTADLATVATTGAYADVTGTPTLATVATSGSYNDLSDQPTIPSITGLATETYVDTAVSNLVDTAPAALDTLNELAAALGDDADFAGTVTTSLAAKANSADLATVATSGSYNDLSDQPTIPADVSDLTDTTSLLGSGGGGGGSFEAVASGALANGSTSILNADGTVSAVAIAETFAAGTAATPGSIIGSLMIPNTSTALVFLNQTGIKCAVATITPLTNSITLGATQSVSSNSALNSSIHPVWDPDTNKAVLFYQVSGVGLVSIAMSVSGDTVTTGSEVIIDSNTSSAPLGLIYDTNRDEFIAFGVHRDNGIHGYVGTISGTTLTFGSGIEIAGSLASNQYYYWQTSDSDIGDVEWDPIANRFLIVFRRSTGYSGYSHVIFHYSVSSDGTSFSFGSAYSNQFSTSYSSDSWDGASIRRGSIVNVGENKFVIGGMGRGGYTSNYRHSVAVYDVNPNSYAITKGAYYYPHNNVTGSSSRMSLGYNSDTGAIVASIYDNSGNAPAKVGTISGTVITFGDAILTSASNSYHYWDYNSSIQRYIIGAQIVNQSSVTNVNAENYAGISDGVYADGATATIQTAGSVDDAQSGLTPGQAYYVQGDGTLGLTPGTPSVFAGTAVSATKLLIGKEAPAATVAYADVTGTPDLSSYATETYVTTAVSNLVDTAPEALNTLNELAAALGDDADFAGTVTTSLAAKANTADLATVATTGAYSDLTGTPTVPADVSDLTDTTSLLGGGGGSFEAVASGSLSDGSTVVLNANGTVSVVAEEIPAIGPTQEVQYNSASSNYSSAAFDSNANKVIVAYQDANNSYFGSVVVGTVSGNTIDFGTPVVYISEYVLFQEVAFDTNLNKVIIKFAKGSGITWFIVGEYSGNSLTFGSPISQSLTTDYASNGMEFDPVSNKLIFVVQGLNNHGYAAVGTISGNSISFGTAVAFWTQNTVYGAKVIADTTSNKIIVLFNGGTAGDTTRRGRAIVGTVSGTSISFGTPTTFHEAKCYNYFATVDTNSNKVVISYVDSEGSPGTNYIKVGTVSGTSISFGGATSLNYQSYQAPRLAFDTTTNKVIIAAKNNIRLGSVSGSSISISTQADWQSDVFDANALIFDNNANKAVIIYTPSTSGNAVVYRTAQGEAVTNLTAENYAGIADAAYADAATATIQTAGSVDDAQSGLTPGQAYYVQANGTLGLTPGTPRVFAGVAASATKLLIGKEGPAVDLSSYASTSYVDTAVSNLVDTAPEALNTLNELAAALNDDADFAGTVTTSLSTKLGTDSVIDGGTV